MFIKGHPEMLSHTTHLPNEPNLDDCLMPDRIQLTRIPPLSREG